MTKTSAENMDESWSILTEQINELGSGDGCDRSAGGAPLLVSMGSSSAAGDVSTPLEKPTYVPTPLEDPTRGVNTVREATAICVTAKEANGTASPEQFGNAERGAGGAAGNASTTSDADWKRV